MTYPSNEVLLSVFPGDDDCGIHDSNIQQSLGNTFELRPLTRRCMIVHHRFEMNSIRMTLYLHCVLMWNLSSS